jgi:hypothetical protein
MLAWTYPPEYLYQKTAGDARTFSAGICGNVVMNLKMRYHEFQNSLEAGADERRGPVPDDARSAPHFPPAVQHKRCGINLFDFMDFFIDKRPISGYMTKQCITGFIE